MSRIHSLVKIPEGAIHLVVTGGALATSFILPHGEIDGLRLCPIYHLTGIECPFCGMTRGFVAISHLDPVAATEFNLGSPLIYAAFVAIFFRSLWSWKNNRLTNQPEFPKPIFVIWSLIGIVTFGYLLYQRWIFPFINL
tara:strand:+ start:243 stop:659 length:417 start_codon:yes stop_codon:yes gene_type:complete